MDCVGAATACVGDTVVACNADGTRGDTVKTCDAMNNEHCTNGDCLSACQVAASNHSYIGCDYWPTTTLTSQLNPYFDFAVAVANPASVGDVTQGASANITVTRAGKTVATKTIAPGDVQTIILPWVAELAQNPAPNAMMPVAEKSVISKGGAYHLVSDLPVTVYQFSPLQFEKPETPTCMDPIPNGQTCHSYSNDATLLLPTSVLKSDYLVLSRQTFTVDQPDPFTGMPSGNPFPIPGFFTVVATVDGTNVMVNYSAYTEPGTGVPAQNPGSMANYMLNKGDVLQVASKRGLSPCATMSTDMGGAYCDLGAKYDLTGTRIMSDQPVAVFGGHACSFVPYNKWACDHLETQMFPLETWGQNVLVVQTEPQIAHEPNAWRVISGSDMNMITFDPASVHAPVMLNTGEYIEFIAEGGFLAKGSGRVGVGQYMVGENYFPMTSVTVGDPSLGQGVSVEQFRNNYDFLTPSTYTKSYVNVVAPMAATVTLDAMTNLTNWTAIGGSGFGYKRVQIQPGAHHITSDQKFGITVSGIASYTSYLYVGGQDVNDIPVQ
jgi:hypothetical protein